MKLKSYLRGLGLGMIVTTVILVIAFQSRNKQMTDEEIVSKAYELGMVETSLFHNKQEETGTIHIEPETTESEAELSMEGQIEPESTIAETTTQEITVAETTMEPETTKTPETTVQETTTAKPAIIIEPTKKPESVTLVFDNITSADKASKILLDAGLITDVEAFNQYLSEKGWATKVGEGEFTFRYGMSFEEIAKIITRQK